MELDPSLFFVPRYDRTVLKTIESRRGKVAQVQHVTFHYNWFGPDGKDHHEQTQFDMTYIFPRELRLLIERHGLEIEHLWGNYDGSDLTPESPRMIVRCCRR
jgi:elongation factor P hydroxylase